jgi:hypothetical protein
MSSSKEYINLVSKITLEWKRSLNPKEGSTYFDRNTESMHVYTRGSWTEIQPNYDNSPPKIKTSDILRNSICICCGAPDTGQFKCKYCKNTLRWYE